MKVKVNAIFIYNKNSHDHILTKKYLELKISPTLSLGWK